MVVVTGSVIARSETLDELWALCVEHVRRSRSEPGCLSHAVYRDPEHALRLVFVEEWTDRAAIEAHFALAASRDFVRSARRLASEPPQMKVLETRPLDPGS
jgi:quinol monooxygenase YgiN